MVAAAMISCRMKLTESAVVERIISLLEKLGLPVEIKGLPIKKIIQELNRGRTGYVLGYN